MSEAASPASFSPHLSVVYERKEMSMATPTFMNYGVTRRLDLPAGIEVLPWPEQVRVVSKVIAQREIHYSNPTPFGRVTGYRYHAAPAVSVSFDTAGRQIASEGH